MHEDVPSRNHVVRAPDYAFPAVLECLVGVWILEQSGNETTYKAAGIDFSRHERDALEEPVVKGVVAWLDARRPCEGNREKAQSLMHEAELAHESAHGDVKVSFHDGNHRAQLMEGRGASPRGEGAKPLHATPRAMSGRRGGP